MVVKVQNKNKPNIVYNNELIEEGTHTNMLQRVDLSTILTIVSTKLYSNSLLLEIRSWAPYNYYILIVFSSNEILG